MRARDASGQISASGRLSVRTSAPGELADLDADVDRHGTTSSRPKNELEAT